MSSVASCVGCQKSSLFDIPATTGQPHDGHDNCYSGYTMYNLNVCIRVSHSVYPQSHEPSLPLPGSAIQNELYICLKHLSNKTSLSACVICSINHASHRPCLRAASLRHASLCPSSLALQLLPTPSLGSTQVPSLSPTSHPSITVPRWNNGLLTSVRCRSPVA